MTFCVIVRAFLPYLMIVCSKNSSLQPGPVFGARLHVYCEVLTAVGKKAATACEHQSRLQCGLQ